MSFDTVVFFVAVIALAIFGTYAVIKDGGKHSLTPVVTPIGRGTMILLQEE